VILDPLLTHADQLATLSHSLTALFSFHLFALLRCHFDRTVCVADG